MCSRCMDSLLALGDSLFLVGVRGWSWDLLLCCGRVLFIVLGGAGGGFGFLGVGLGGLLGVGVGVGLGRV